MYFAIEKRVSHKKWRSFVKAERRRLKRKKLASLRDYEKEKELAVLRSNPAYCAWVEEQEALMEHAHLMEMLAAEKRRNEWMAKDLALHHAWIQDRKKKRKLEEENQLKEEKIKKEWEEALRKEEKEKEEKKKVQEALLQESTRTLGQREVTRNPDPPPGHSQPYPAKKQESCPFFMKTGACRFGLYCSRAHDYPASSRTLLLPNMYTHLVLDAEATDDYDADLSLEYTDADRYTHFRDFYMDVLPEFEKFGRLVQFKVCCNKSPHLKGNVYVQYARVEAAERAAGLFNGRWYAGKQISCIFVPVDRWKPAICGLHWSHKCPKGDNCNFLHVYKNPGNAFYKADKDCLSSEDNDSGTPRESRSSHRSERRNRSRSREKDRRSRVSPRSSSKQGRRKDRSTSSDSSRRSRSSKGHKDQEHGWRSHDRRHSKERSINGSSTKVAHKSCRDSSRKKDKSSKQKHK